MHNFDFRNPTRILFGKGRMADLKDQVPEGAKVPIFYDMTAIDEHAAIAPDDARRILEAAL